MAATVQTIVDGGVAHSTVSDPNRLYTTAEIVRVVNDYQRKYMARANALNPHRFKSASLLAAPGAGLPWTITVLFSDLVHLEKSDGTEVRIVDEQDSKSEVPPRVRVEARNLLFTIGDSADPDPVSDQLKLWYAPIPVELTSLASNLDDRFPEQYNRILMLEVAMYLALKDGRIEEAASFQGQLDAWVDTFDRELAPPYSARTRRFE